MKTKHGKLIPGINDLATILPNIVCEFRGGDPTKVLAGTNKKLPWKCRKCGHEWETAGYHRVRGHGCPCCSNRVCVPGVNCMATKRPDLAEEHQGNSTTVIAGTNKRLHWKCRVCGNKWATSGANRVCGSGCPRCSRKPNNCKIPGCNLKHLARGFCSKHYQREKSAKLKILNPKKEKPPIIKTHPQYAKHLVEPKNGLHLTHGSSAIVEWHCNNGFNHTYKGTVKDRCNGHGCTICRNLSVLPGFNDIRSTHPQIASQLADKKLGLNVSFGSNKIVEWTCNNGYDHTFKMSVSKRCSGIGCNICRGFVVLTGFNDMATTHKATLAAEYLGDPKRVIAGTRKKLPWKCKICGHKWKATGALRVNNKTGCPKCFVPGFKKDKPGVFYILTRPGQYKIGIMNVGSKRIIDHARRGWKVLDTIKSDGLSVASLEQVILGLMSKNKTPMGDVAFREPFDGYTESWQNVDLEVRSIRQLCSILKVNLESYLSPTPTKTRK